MEFRLLAIVKNLLGDTIRIYKDADEQYYIQDKYKLYKMSYNDENKEKFNPIDFLDNATYEDESTLTFNQFIHLLINMSISDVKHPLKQPNR